MNTGAEVLRQHQNWTPVRARLWGREEIVRKKRGLPAPAAPKPQSVVAMRPPERLDRYGWPIYRPLAPYDHFDGQIPERSRITMKQITHEVAAKHGVTVNDILSPRRNRTVVYARQEAMWRCKMETVNSLPQIGRALGGKDHTTVLHGIKKHEERMREGTGG